MWLTDDIVFIKSTRGNRKVKVKLNFNIKKQGFHNSQEAEATQRSINGQMDKHMDVVYVYIQWRIIQLYKRKKSCHMLQQDEPWSEISQSHKKNK